MVIKSRNMSVPKRRRQMYKPKGSGKGNAQVTKNSASNKINLHSKNNPSPRYFLVNLLATTPDEAVEELQRLGWQLLEPEVEGDYASYIEVASNLGDKEFVRDFHVPELFVFPPGVKQLSDDADCNRMFVPFFKSMCVASHLLAPTPGSTVLDICSASGVALSYMAAMMENSGTVYGVKKDSKLSARMAEQAAKNLATCVTMIEADQDVDDADEVEYILVNVGPKMLGVTTTDEKCIPLHKLTLQRALTRYPNVKRVVYAALCTPDNLAGGEEVVEAVLRKVNKDPANPLFKVSEQLPAEWTSRGCPQSEIGRHCLRFDKGADLTFPVFIAVVERAGSSVESGGEGVAVKKKIGKQGGSLVKRTGEGVAVKKKIAKKGGSLVESGLEGVAVKKKVAKQGGSLVKRTGEGMAVKKKAGKQGGSLVKRMK